MSNTDFSFHTHKVVVVWLLSPVWLSAAPWTATCQASYLLKFLKLMSTESITSSNHLSICRPFSSCPQTFPASGSFPMSQFFASWSQSIGISSLASGLPQFVSFRIDWFHKEENLYLFGRYILKNFTWIIFLSQ